MVIESFAHLGYNFIELLFVKLYIQMYWIENADKRTKLFNTIICDIASKFV